MIRSTILTYLLGGFLLFLSAVLPARGQTVRFNMEVQPELGVEVLQDLDFGTVVSNSGRQQIELGEVRMGVFKIKALATQSAVLSLQKPDTLMGGQNGGHIPISIEAAYASEPRNYTNIQSFTNNQLRVTLGDGNGRAESPNWENGYVYIYGSITVGEVPQGDYSGTLVLNVTYQ